MNRILTPICASRARFEAPLHNAGYEMETIGRELPIEDNHRRSERLTGDESNNVVGILLSAKPRGRVTLATRHLGK